LKINLYGENKSYKNSQGDIVKLDICISFFYGEKGRACETYPYKKFPIFVETIHLMMMGRCKNTYCMVNFPVNIAKSSKKRP
jgi:hypothetical protein